MKKRFVALLLAAALSASLLSGCSSSSSPASSAGKETISQDHPDQNTADQKGDSESGAEDGSAVAAEIPEVPEEAWADPVSYVTDGAIAVNDVVMAVDGMDVDAGEFFYWFMYWYTYTQYYYVSQYGISLNASSQVSQDSDMMVGELVMNETKNTVTTNNMLAARALEGGMEITEERQKEIDNLEKQYSENARLLYLTSLDSLKNVYRKAILADEEEAFLASGGQLEEITAESIQNFVDENNYRTIRYILLSTSSLSDEEAKARADEIFAELQGLEGEEREKRFAELQASDNADGNKDTFTYGDLDSLVGGFREKAAGLAAGELGQTDKTDYGYFVILGEELDEKVVRDDLIAHEYEKQVESWKEQAVVTTSEALENLDLQAVFEKIDLLEKASAALISKEMAETAEETK